jgi:hypothetical protein
MTDDNSDAGAEVAEKELAMATEKKDSALAAHDAPPPHEISGALAPTQLAATPSDGIAGGVYWVGGTTVDAYGRPITHVP